MNGYADVVRYINLAIASTAFVLLVLRAVRYWSRYEAKTRDFWWVVTSWTCAVIFGTTEVLMGWDTQIRVVFTLAALLLTLKILVYPTDAIKPQVTDEF